jgi:hypothetical protein
MVASRVVSRAMSCLIIRDWQQTGDSITSGWHHKPHWSHATVSRASSSSAPQMQTNSGPHSCHMQSRTVDKQPMSTQALSVSLIGWQQRWVYMLAASGVLHTQWNIQQVMCKPDLLGGLALPPLPAATAVRHGCGGPAARAAAALLPRLVHRRPPLLAPAAASRVAHRLQATSPRCDASAGSTAQGMHVLQAGSQADSLHLVKQLACGWCRQHRRTRCRWPRPPRCSRRTRRGATCACLRPSVEVALADWAV